MIRFAYPEALFLLLLLFPLWKMAAIPEGTLRFPKLDLFKRANAKNKWNPSKIFSLLRMAFLIFFVIALARPQKGKSYSEITSKGVDIMLAIDTSESMKAQDFHLDDAPVDRLSVIKKVAKEFIEKRPSDRFGLIVFGDEAFTQCPLTLDHGIVLDFLDRTSIGQVGPSTAIGQAIGSAVARLKNIHSKSKIMILLTDGENTSGRLPPLKAAELAKKFQIKIYTIGIGSNGKVPFLVDTFFGKRYIYQEAPIDETALKEIAKITQGKYFRATNTDELQDIYNDINEMEKTDFKMKEYTEYKELFAPFALMALLLLLLEILLKHTVLKQIP